jgi:hypothetical protein
MVREGYWNDAMQEKLGELTREHRIEMDKVHAVLQKVVVQQEEQTVILQHIEEAMTAVQQGVAATRKLVQLSFTGENDCPSLFLLSNNKL